MQLNEEQHTAVKKHSGVMEWLAQEEARVQTELQHLQQQRQRAQQQLEAFISQHLGVNISVGDWHLDIEKGTLNGPTEQH